MKSTRCPRVAQFYSGYSVAGDQLWYTFFLTWSLEELCLCPESHKLPLELVPYYLMPLPLSIKGDLRIWMLNAHFLIMLKQFNKVWYTCWTFCLYLYRYDPLKGRFSFTIHYSGGVEQEFERIPISLREFGGSLLTWSC